MKNVFSPHTIIGELERNHAVFKAILSGASAPLIRWKPAPDKWCLLQIICHLYDEEREDFRARLRHVLTQPNEKMTGIDPQGWVESRSYMDQDYQAKLDAFLDEREQSIQWLKSLDKPSWDNAYQHPTLGPLSGKTFLSNWLAHDFIHIRQITRTKMQYLMAISEQDLTYAGNW